MGRLRDKFSKLSAKLPASRSTSPAPGVSTQPSESVTDELPPEELPTTTHISKQLWNQAYDDLKGAESSQAIVGAYEKILSDQLKVKESSGANIISPDHAVRWRQMEQLVSNGLENTAKDVNRKQNVNQWLDMSKPLREAVGIGLKAVPQAAVPWAGICCALEILSSPLTEPKKNRDGMEYVLKRMDWYWRLSPWLLQDSQSSDSSQPLRDQLEKQLISLYQKLLLFQMKSVILYHRSRFAVFMRDLPKVDDWVSHVKEIKDFEAALGVDSTQYNTLDMRTNLQEISVTTKEHAQWQRQERLDEKDSECLRELRVTTPQKDKKTIVSSKGGLFYESYRWITENNEYQQWLKEDDNNLLWIKGDPGKGKTMLLAGIIEELEKSTPQSVFYFFCQATEPRLRTAINVLRGLIWFLATTRPRLVSYVREEYEKEGNGVFSDSNAWQTLTVILTTILEDEDSENFTFVVDALDECTTDRDQLVRLISRVSSSHKAKWVISSRNWPEIERRLDGVQNKVRLQLELNHAAISAAVKSFILRKVDELDGENNYDESTREEVQKYLLANADDTFLWVSLVCEELGKPDVMSHHTLDILKSFPAGLGKLYERMVEKLNQSRDKDLCKAALGVVGVAYRPLSLAELGASDSRLNGLVGNSVALSNIVRSCGSFLAIRDGTIYTVHQSVKDFLRTSQEVVASGFAQQHYNVFFSSVQMMQKGLHRDLYRLNDPGVLIDEIKVPESHPLLSLGYACVHWADHFHDGYLQEPPSERVSAFALLDTFFRGKYLYWLEAMSLLGCASEAVTAVRKLQNDIQHDASPDLKDLVADAWRFAMAHKPIVDTTPLQLYDSALIFSPEHSIIRECFKEEISDDIEVHAPTLQNWSACLQSIPGTSWCFEFSPDGKLILTLSVDLCRVSVLDTSNGAHVASFGPVDYKVENATWHPNGEQLAVNGHTMGGERYIHVYNLSENEPIITHQVQEGIGYSHQLSFSPDGQLLAFGVFSRDSTHEALDHIDIIIWNTQSKAIHHKLSAGGWVEYFGWVSSPSSTQCLLVVKNANSGNFGPPMSYIDLWDISTEYLGAKVSSLNFPDWRCGPAGISHDRTRLALVTPQGVKICSWAQSLTVEKILQEPHDHFASTITWTADNDQLIINGIGNFVVLDVGTGEEIGRQAMSTLIPVRFGKGNQIAACDNGSLRIWDLDIIQRDSAGLRSSAMPAQKSIDRIVHSPVESIAVISNKEEVEILSRQSGERLLHSDFYPLINGGVMLGHDGYLAIPFDSQAVDIYQFDTDGGHYHKRLQLQLGDVDGNHDSNIAVAFGPPGQVALCSNLVSIWDVKTGVLLQTISAGISENGKHPMIAFSANGYLAIACRYVIDHAGEIMIWDTNTMREIKLLGLLWDQSFEEGNCCMSLNESCTIAVSTYYRVFIGSVNHRTWIGVYHFPHLVPNVNFDLGYKSRLDTGFGVLEIGLDLEYADASEMPLKLEPHWDPRQMRVSNTALGTWLMKDSRRILRIPVQSFDGKRFSIQTNLESGISTVVMVHDACLFLIRHQDRSTG